MRGIRVAARLLAVIVLFAVSFTGLGGPRAALGAAPTVVPRSDLVGIAGNAFPWEANWQSFGTLLDANTAGWARVELRWEQIEPGPSNWQWGGTDSLVNAYAAHGFQMLGLLDYSVAWASGGTGSGAVFGPPTDLDAWESYVRATATRYHDRVHAWEIWNEPDVAMFWNGRDGGDPATYLTLLERAYRAIKSVDPSAVVMNGGLTGTARGASFLNALLDLGGGQYLDAVAFHAYLPNDGLDNDAFRTAVWPLVSQARQRAGKPMWITEFGWSSGPGGVAAAGSEAAQANDLARELPMLFDLGDVAHVFVFQFKDPNDAPNSFGITRPDGSAKPADTAVSTIAAQLQGLSFERHVDLGVGGVWDMRFSSADRTVDVVWSQSGDHDLTFPTGRPSVQVWHIDGSQQRLAAGGDGVPLHVGSDPVLIDRTGQAPPPSGTAGCQAFAETGQRLCDGFLAFWQQSGGVAILGLPISPEMPEGGRTVQYLERTKLEYHPEWAGSQWAVVGELAGTNLTAGRRGEAPFQPLPATTGSDAGCTFYPQTGHRLCLGFQAYWQQHGGLQVFGYPISEEFPEQNPDTGQVYTVQYFERARFEYHPDNPPDWQVELGRLGTQLYAARYH